MKYELTVGEVFNEWTVIDHTSKTMTKSRESHYLCKCSCGLTEKYVKSSDLVKGRSKCCNRCSLYCGIGELSGTYISVVKKGAKLRNIEFNITSKQMVEVFELQNKKCALTGLDISLHRNYSQGNREKQTASLDRIDSSRGYVADNIQWVHKDVNIMKNKFSQEYFLEMCKRITENESNRIRN